MKAFIMKHTSAFRLCLSLSIMAVLTLTPCMTAKAIDTNVPDLTWTNLTARSTVNFTRIVSPSDVHWIEIGATGRNGYCAYDTYMESDMVFTFYASGPVSHLSPGNLEYYFSSDLLRDYYGSKVEFLNASYDYSLIMAGNEYPLPALQGWVTLPSIYPVNSYITLKVHFSGLVRLKSDYVSTSADGYKLGEVVDFKADLLRWKVHPIGDTVSDIKGLVTANNDMLNRLVNGNAGIQGAIEHQTQQQHEDALKEQQLQQHQSNLTQQQIQQQHEDANNIMNGYDSTVGNSSLGNFNEGIGKYEDAQSAITDSAYDNLDKFTIPGGGIGNMVAGLTASVPIASTMLQAIFQSSGDFTIIMTVTLILTITCILLGIAKYYLR